jgi:D-alanyl-D-alanine carboxypeptidase (penicillin-binding protein 5/6)
LKGAEEKVPVGNATPIYFTQPHGECVKLVVTPKLPDKAIAPIAQGQSLGQVTVSLDGKALQTVQATALKPVAEGSLTHRLVDTIRLKFGW